MFCTSHARRKKKFSWNLLSWFVAFKISFNFANQMKNDCVYKLWSEDLLMFLIFFADVFIFFLCVSQATKK
jgi:hypothetical protein